MSDRMALSIDKQIYGNRHPNMANRLNNIGAAWDSLGDSKKAIEYYEQGLAIDKELYGGRHPNVAIKLNNSGSALF
jgi:tetratricopeptide (TPR) repeat protein